MTIPTSFPAWSRFSIEAFLLLFAAYAVASGPGSDLANADTLISVFVSLESWTLFYWGQDRFGMLLPFLAMPVTDSFWNLMVQNILTVALLLTGMLCAFAALGIGRSTTWALVVLAVLLAFPHGQIPLLLLTINQSYAPALGLFGVATYLLRRKTPMRVAAVILMILAGWTNAGAALFVGCVSLSLLCFEATRLGAMRVLAGTILSIVVHGVLQRFASPPLLTLTTIAIPAIEVVPSLLWAFWTDAVRLIGWSFWVTIGAAWIIAGVLAARRPSSGRPVLLLCGVALATLVYGSAMAVFFQGLGRHIVPAIPLLVMCPLITLVREVRTMTDWRAASPAVLVVIVLQTGLDSPERVRRGLVERLGQGEAERLYLRGVTIVTGDYWAVWPWTFAINMTYERHGRAGTVLPVTIRAERLIERRRADVKASARVAIVPSGDLDPWIQARLPRLRVDTRFTGYSLATVTPTGEASASGGGGPPHGVLALIPCPDLKPWRRSAFGRR